MHSIGEIQAATRICPDSQVGLGTLDKEEFKKTFDSLLTPMSTLPLSAGTQAIISSIMGKLDTVRMREIDVLFSAFTEAVMADLESQYYLQLDSKHIDRYAQKEPAFGKQVSEGFPSASYDISEASKCIALERSTAAVFHLMRSIEVALKAVAYYLGVEEPKNPSWGIWLQCIRDERQRRGKGWEEKTFFQDVAMRLDAIKDAQRNATMHIENVYTEEETEEIFDLTKNFMKKIASRMNEKGRPSGSQ